MLTLPSSDLQRSLRFYRDGLGLPTDGVAAPEHGGHHLLFVLEGGLSLLLFDRTELNRLTPGGAPQAGGAILSYIAENREEVDSTIAAAQAAGGTRVGDVVEESFGYHGHFGDPDGNLWEVVCFNG
ncbi:MAG: VOC family protein [Hyphomicrobiales bacterium]|nr:MAG: VOC family protein [Hyphomicrobiales bacterium]